jgi:ABC-2 type transport system permease protein
MSFTAFSADLPLAFWQARYELRSFARNRGRGLFTFIFPVMFLVIFGTLYQGKHLPGQPRIPYDQYFVPGILAYAVVSTTYVNLAINTATLRDDGILKRMQGQPLPGWTYLAGRVLATIVIVAAMTALTLLVGTLAYGIQLRVATLPALILTLLLGTAAFTTLGIGIVLVIPNADAAPAIVNLTVLPLTFISGVWFTTKGMPAWLDTVARIFPVRPLADALQHAFSPYAGGAGFQGGDLLALAIWTLVGVRLMVMFVRRTAV